MLVMMMGDSARAVRHDFGAAADDESSHVGGIGHRSTTGGLLLHPHYGAGFNCQGPQGPPRRSDGHMI